MADAGKNPPGPACGGLSPIQRPARSSGFEGDVESAAEVAPELILGGEPPAANREMPALDSPPRQPPRETLAPGTPSRHSGPGGLQYGSPWRTGPATPLSAQLWRSIAPELTPDHPIGNGFSSQGPVPRIHITVPERLGLDRCVRFDHGGTTYSVTIPPDYSPGSRVEVELTAPLSRPPPPPLGGLDNSMRQNNFGSPVAGSRRFESPGENDTLSVLRIRRDVHRFREDLRANNAMKQHLRHQLELLQEESELIDACLTSKAEIKRLSEELQETEEQVRTKKEQALIPSPTKSTPSSRPEATGQSANIAATSPDNASPAASPQGVLDAQAPGPVSPSSVPRSMQAGASAATPSGMSEVEASTVTAAGPASASPPIVVSPPPAPASGSVLSSTPIPVVAEQVAATPLSEPAQLFGDTPDRFDDEPIFVAASGSREERFGHEGRAPTAAPVPQPGQGFVNAQERFEDQPIFFSSATPRAESDNSVQTVSGIPPAAIAGVQTSWCPHRLFKPATSLAAAASSPNRHGQRQKRSGEASVPLTAAAGGNSPTTKRQRAATHGEPSSSAIDTRPAGAISASASSASPTPAASIVSQGALPAGPVASEGAVDEEDRQRRLAKRGEGVASVKRKPEYQNLLNLEARGVVLLDRPRTPDPTDENLSKRAWEASMQHWREGLRRL